MSMKYIILYKLYIALYRWFKLSYVYVLFCNFLKISDIPINTDRYKMIAWKRFRISY